MGDKQRHGKSDLSKLSQQNIKRKTTDARGRSIMAEQELITDPEELEETIDKIYEEKKEEMTGGEQA